MTISTTPRTLTELDHVRLRSLVLRLDGGERLRMRIIHPMDTGLAAGIPAFHIEDIVISDAEGRTLSRIQPLEPVSENPSFTLDLYATAPNARLHVTGRDNNGNRIDAWVSR